MSRNRWFFPRKRGDESAEPARTAVVPRVISCVSLEDRLLYSATPLMLDAPVPETVDHTTAPAEDVSWLTLDTATESPAVSDGPESLSDLRDWEAGPDLEDGNRLEADATAERLELVFVDSSVPEYEKLLSGITGPDADSDRYEVILLDGEEDGLQSITDHLSHYRDVDAIHIIAHGTDAGLQLGNVWIDESSVDDHSPQFQAWQSSLSEEADVLLYGCDLAGSADGQQLVDRLGALLDADVAASDDLTGHVDLHADWDLEYQQGTIESSIIVTESIQHDWHHVLSTFVVTSTSNSGTGSLRDAIAAANNHAGLDTITFAIGGGGARTISINFSLPEITDSVIIDGTTQAGYAGTPLITLDGEASFLALGLNVTAGGSTIKGLSIQNFDLGGIWIHEGGNNVIQGNYIGTNGTSDEGNGFNGIYIESSNNQIGGLSASARNVISGNSLSGIQIVGANATQNVVQGNYIGLNAAGTSAIANGQDGIYINQATENRIEGNVIGGNARDGIRINGSSASDNLVTGNWIGTNASGTGAVANSADGVRIIQAGDNWIQGNTISGNGDDGIDISGDNAVGNQILGNRIGTTGSGLGSLANGDDGIVISDSAHDNVIGNPGQGNTIAHNGGIGVAVVNTTGAEQGNTLRANAIFGNSGREIDLNDNGITANDSLDGDAGANLLQNHPTVRYVAIDGSVTHIAGTMQGAANATLLIDLYASTGVDTGGTGQAENYLGSTTVVTDSTGLGRWEVVYNQALTTAMYVTATATNAQGNTSEFGAAQNAQPRKLYFIQQGSGIRRISTQAPGASEQLVNGINDPGDLVVDAVAGKMYWTDLQNDTLNRANLDGSSVETLISNLGNPQGLHIDTVAGKIYWASQTNRTIVSASLDGSNMQVLVNTSSKPVDVDVDTMHGRIYWTEDQNDTLWRSDLNGSNAAALFTNLGRDPGEIAVDAIHGHVYWTDKHDDAIYRANLDGSGAVQWMTGLNNPSGLALDQVNGHLYWSELGATSLSRSSLDGTNVESLSVGIPNVVGVDLAAMPASNGAVTVDLNAGVTVLEGGQGLISSGRLHTSDSDTSPGQLVYTITNAAHHGQLELTTASGFAISSFTQADIDNGLLRYVHSGDEALIDSFDFSVSDGTTVGGGRFFVDISPVNDAPTLSTPQLTISEGQTVTITTAHLNSADVDTNANSLVYTVSNVLGGRFELTTAPGASVASFSAAQVQGGQVRFVHDGSETAAAFQAQVSDGSTTTGPQSAVVSYTPVNDAPVRDVNTGLQVTEGGMVTITSSQLHASDAEQGPTQLVFALTQSPTLGRIERTSNAGVAVTTFTQQEVNNGLLRYVHFGTENNSETLQITVSDGTVSVAGTIAVTVTPVNDAPIVHANSMTIAEGGTVTLNNTNWSVTDVDTTATSLRYTVSSVQNGYFQNRFATGTAITTFTQRQIENGVIQFVHDGTNQSPQYSVSVTDGTTTVAIPGNAVSFTAVNDAPVAKNDKFTVVNTSSVSLDANSILQNDIDEEGAILTIASASNPTHGTLTIVSPGQLVYTPQENFVGTDRITYQISDGTQLSNVATIEILVLPDAGSQVIQLPETAGGTSSTRAEDTNQSDSAPPDLDSANISAAIISQLTENQEPSGSAEGGLTDQESSSQLAVVPVPQPPVAVISEEDDGDALSSRIQLRSYDRSNLVLRDARAGLDLDRGDSRRPTGTGVSEAEAQVLRRSLDEMSEAMHQRMQFDTEQFQKFAGGTAAASIGYVMWILRGGSLLTSLATQMPIWRLVDPLPIFDAVRDGRRHEGESLESIVTSGSSPGNGTANRPVESVHSA